MMKIQRIRLKKKWLRMENWLNEKIVKFRALLRPGGVNGAV
jgi:hypothetical protein